MLLLLIIKDVLKETHQQQEIATPEEVLTQYRIAQEEIQQEREIQIVILQEDRIILSHEVVLVLHIVEVVLQEEVLQAGLAAVAEEETNLQDFTKYTF